MPDQTPGTPPKLKIEDLEFELEAGFSEGYTNNLECALDAASNFLTHSGNMYWKGGSFKPLSIAIFLAVGVQSAIQTPTQLKDVVTKLFSYALSEQQVTVAPPKRITIEVGSWYKKKGYIRIIDVDWDAPWDNDTGMAMTAKVRLEFMYDFMAGDISKYSQYLPNSSNWKPDYIGKS